MTEARPMEGELLSSQDAAELLGVGPSSVKRWADAGVLPCVRTAGGHRRFHREAVNELLGKLRSDEGDRAERWLALLLGDDDVHAVHARLLEERSQRGAWWRVADSLGVVLDELGRRWERGVIGIIDEHRASERLTRGLVQCSATWPHVGRAPRALLAVAEQDAHTLGLRLAELCLREAGWETHWAGRDTPNAELLEVIARERPALVGLSASVSSAARPLQRQARALVEACSRARSVLVLGGSGPWPEGVKGARRVRSFAQLAAILDEIVAQD